MSWTGYRIHFTETCAEDAPNLITDVTTTLAPVWDVIALSAIQANLAARDVLPEEQIVDAGYTTAETLVDSQKDAGIDLAGPVNPDLSWQARAQTGSRSRCSAWIGRSSEQLVLKATPVSPGGSGSIRIPLVLSPSALPNLIAKPAPSVPSVLILNQDLGKSDGGPKPITKPSRPPGNVRPPRISKKSMLIEPGLKAPSPKP